MKSMLNVAGGFAAGVLAVLLLDEVASRATARRRRHAAPESDERLRERVRAKVGEWASHPRAIEVEVNEGIVRLSGQVPAGELDGLLTRLAGLRGVRKVRNALSTA